MKNKSRKGLKQKIAKPEFKRKKRHNSPKTTRLGAKKNMTMTFRTKKIKESRKNSNQKWGTIKKETGRCNTDNWARWQFEEGP